MRSLPALLIVALLLAGCKTTRYELRPPATETGRACVTQCAAIRESCRGNEIRRAKNDAENCERQAERSLRACLDRADSKDTRKDCERKKPNCSRSANESRCDEDHRSCYRACGGQVNKIVE